MLAGLQVYEDVMASTMPVATHRLSHHHVHQLVAASCLEVKQLQAQCKKDCHAAECVSQLCCFSPRIGMQMKSQCENKNISVPE